MIDKGRVNEALQAAWAADSELDGPCPPSEQIFDAVAGRLDPADTRSLILHTTNCGACAQSWRLALEIERARSSVSRPSFGRKVLPALWAAAAALSLAVGVYWMLPQIERPVAPPQGPSLMRGVDHAGPALMIPDGASLPIDEFRLRWTALDQARDYRVEAGDAELNAVYLGTTLTTEQVIPPARLAEGQLIYWRVTARLADGSERASPTRSLIVDPPAAVSHSSEAPTQ